MMGKLPYKKLCGVLSVEVRSVPVEILHEVFWAAHEIRSGKKDSVREKRTLLEGLSHEKPGNCTSDSNITAG
jgi:hypothetical protein